MGGVAWSLRRQRLLAGVISAVSIVGALAVRGEPSESAAQVITTSARPVVLTSLAPRSATTTTAASAPLPAIDTTAATAAATTTAASTAVTETTTAVPPTAPANAAQQLARPIPSALPASPPPPDVPKPPWADSTRTTSAGYVSTDVGCAGGTDAGSLDAFFASRVGPVIGTDYQHVYPLGGNRFLWLFQDAFIDHSGAATKLNQAGFAHNIAMVQQGKCFTLLHRGTPKAPSSFDLGAGEDMRWRWFWPMGGELAGDRLYVFWAEMDRDASDPVPGDGLGWHPARTWLASYDVATLARLSFDPAPNDDVRPIYGYAVSSDADYSYLFGNTFEQNLSREGGFWTGPHSATSMLLARVPRGRLADAPEYRTADGWSPNRADARPIMQRYWTENPMQPRYYEGVWTAVTKIDGYWGEELAIDVATDPWGPWTTIERRGLSPHVADLRIINTYHAHLMPWRSGGGLVISVSQNARDMYADAYPHPERYRPMFISAGYSAPPPPPPPTEPSTTVIETTTTAATTTLAPTTTMAATTTAAVTTTPATTTTLPATTTTVAVTTTSIPAITTTRPATTTVVATTTVPPSTTVAATTTTKPPASTSAAKPTTTTATTTTDG